MKPVALFGGVLTIWLLAASFSWGDIPAPGRRSRPAPKPQPVAAKPTHPLSIKIDAAAKTATLRIPRSLLDARRRNADATRPSHTIIAGIALSCAAASVLVWRRGGRGARVAMLAVIAAAGIAGGITYADLLPGRTPAFDPVEDVQQDAQQLQVVLELVNDGKSISLTVPAGALAPAAPGSPAAAPAPAASSK